MFKFEVEVDGLVCMFEGDVGKSGMSESELIKMVEDGIDDYGDDFRLMSCGVLDDVNDVGGFGLVFLGIK